jgi:hypothetical protein
MDLLNEGGAEEHRLFGYGIIPNLASSHHPPCTGDTSYHLSTKTSPGPGTALMEAEGHLFCLPGSIFRYVCVFLFPQTPYEWEPVWEPVWDLPATREPLCYHVLKWAIYILNVDRLCPPPWGKDTVGRV